MNKVSQVKLLYVGQRNKPFTIHGNVSGEDYYVEDRGAITIDERDLEAIVASNPENWQRAEAPQSRTRNTEE